MFIKIGGNANMWEIYKWFTLNKGLIKLDLAVNLEYAITIGFMMYYEDPQWYFLIAGDIIFFGLLIACFLLINKILNKKKRK